MEKFILGKKLGMTTIHSEKKGALNITLIECEPNFISLIRTKKKDNYSAAQLKVGKTKNKFYRREFRLEKESKLKKGDKITVDVFKEGDKVRVSGVSKAKGFQGVMKKHGFHGSPHSHGHRHDWRAPGSIGSAYPQHVMKGKKMAGRMGGTKSTVKNIEIVYIDKNKNLLGVKGAVPGVSGRVVEIVG